MENNNKTTVHYEEQDDPVLEWYSCDDKECDTYSVLRNFKYCPMCGKEIDWENSKHE